MKAGDLVRDKNTGSIGIIANAWIDENDATSMIVEFLEKKDVAVYWSPGLFQFGALKGSHAYSTIYHTDALELVDDND